MGQWIFLQEFRGYPGWFLQLLGSQSLKFGNRCHMMSSWLSTWIGRIAVVGILSHVKEIFSIKYVDFCNCLKSNLLEILCRNACTDLLSCRFVFMHIRCLVDADGWNGQVWMFCISGLQYFSCHDPNKVWDWRPAVGPTPSWDPIHLPLHHPVPSPLMLSQHCSM